MSAKNDTTGQSDTRYLAKVQIFTLYERFWHWTQAILILLMLFTGFHLHSSLDFMSFRTAWQIHVISAIALITLWVFTIFWHFVTGNWRQFVPLLEEMEHAPTFAQAMRAWLTMIWRIARYYAWGILHGEVHPFRKRLRRKHNPLQAFAYFGLMAFIGPLLWITGMALLGWDFWKLAAPLATTENWRTLAAFGHTLGAWLMLLFVIVHIYMATTGKTPLYYIRGMITGVEEIWLSEEELCYLRSFHPNRLLKVEQFPSPASATSR